MKKEDKKEILTREFIKKELKETYIHNLLIRFLIFSFFALFFYLYITIFSGEFLTDTTGYADVGKKVLFVICIVIAIVIAVFAFYVVYSMYLLISRLIAINKSNFEIVTDKLVNKEKDGGHKHYIMEYSTDEMELHDHRKPYIFLFPRMAIFNLKKAFVLYKLQFAKYKSFYIPEGKLYRWSEKYRMEHWAVYRWAEVGDEFYMITVNDKVLNIYNTKHFELKD